MKKTLDLLKLRDKGYKCTIIRQNDGSKACIFCGNTQGLEIGLVSVDDNEKQIVDCNICNTCVMELKLVAQASCMPFQDIIKLKIEALMKQPHLKASEFFGKKNAKFE